MRPGDLPDRACVAARRVGTSIHTQTWGYRSPFESVSTRPLRLAVYDVKDLNRTVTGARRQTLPVVIQLRVVLAGALEHATFDARAIDVQSCPHGEFLSPQTM